MAAMESQLLPTSLPRCKHKRQAQAESRSLSARSVSALMSDEKLRGGGRSLLIRKYARSVSWHGKTSVLEDFCHGRFCIGRPACFS